MRVRMLTIWASQHGCFGPGQVVDLPDVLGQQLIKARSAEPVDAAGGATKPRAVTGRRPHTAPPAASTAVVRPVLERATVDPHADSGRPEPEDPEEPESDELEDEIEEEEDEELEEPDELPDAMSAVPAEPREPEAPRPPKGPKDRDRKPKRNKAPKAPKA